MIWPIITLIGDIVALCKEQVSAGSLRVEQLLAFLLFLLPRPFLLFHFYSSPSLIPFLLFAFLLQLRNFVAQNFNNLCLFADSQTEPFLQIFLRFLFCFSNFLHFCLQFLFPSLFKFLFQFFHLFACLSLLLFKFSGELLKLVSVDLFSLDSFLLQKLIHFSLHLVFQLLFSFLQFYFCLFHPLLAFRGPLFFDFSKAPDSLKEGFVMRIDLVDELAVEMLESPKGLLVNSLDVLRRQLHSAHSFFQTCDWVLKPLKMLGMWLCQWGASEILCLWTPAL